MSALAEAGVGTVIAVNSGAKVIGNGASRALNGEKAFDGRQIAIDAGVGAVWVELSVTAVGKIAGRGAAALEKQFVSCGRSCQLSCSIGI